MDFETAALRRRRRFYSKWRDRVYNPGRLCDFIYTEAISASQVIRLFVVSWPRVVECKNKESGEWEGLLSPLFWCFLFSSCVRRRRRTLSRALFKAQSPTVGSIQLWAQWPRSP